jgi:hypothetical protein
MSAPYVCAYHHYEGDDPCDACEMDPARTDEDADEAMAEREIALREDGADEGRARWAETGTARR